MGFFGNRRLLTKINLVIALFLIAFLVVGTYVHYRLQRAFVMEEAIEKARLIASEAIRAREYISDQLQIGEVELSQKRYGLIPVVASTRIGEQVAEDLDYSIRQVSNRYRNPKNAPDPFESGVLERMQRNPSLEEEFAVTDLDGQRVFRYLQPFRAEESCLECHGDPARAPAFIKQLFPEKSDQAYNYRIGEVIGAASVTIPMDRLYAQVFARARYDFLLTAGIFLILMAVLGILIKVAVTHPLGRLGEGIAEILRTGRFEKKIPRRGRDEIGILIDGFNEMVEDLQQKTLHLEESERRFRILTETARDAIVSFLGNGQIILFNRQAERMFGYSKREILGSTIDLLVHEDCASLREAGPEAYLRQEAEGLMQRLNTFPGRMRDGSKIMLELSMSVAESDGHLFYTAILREAS